MDGLNEQVKMTRLISVGGAFAGHVMAARLEAEGIAVELRGAMHSPYQFTVGEMSRVDVYVAPEDLDDARVVLLIDELDATLDLPPQKDRPLGLFRGRAAWVVGTSLVCLGVIPFARMLLSN
jgi:hypothetical protein